MGSQMETVTIKVDESLKRKMEKLNINWSSFIRETIKSKVELEERRLAAEKLLSDARIGRRVVPHGFIENGIREDRDER